MDSPSDAPRPLLSIVRGEPTAAEVAAVTVVLGVLANRDQGATATRTSSSRWSARERALRQPVTPAPGGWRASALPR